MARRRFSRRSYAGKAIARRKLNWLDGITTNTESNVAPGSQTNVVLIGATPISRDQTKLVVERIVGEIWTGFIGTPSKVEGIETELMIAMLLYTRPQDVAGTNSASLDPTNSDDRESHRILWSRYDYMHLIGVGASNGVGFYDTTRQWGQPAHVDIRVKRIIDTSDTDLILSVGVPSSSDLSCFFVDNLRVLEKQS